MDFSEKDFQKIMSAPLFRGANKENVKSILTKTGCGVLSFSSGEVIMSPESREKSAGILLSGKAVVNTPDPSKKNAIALSRRARALWHCQSLHRRALCQRDPSP